MRGIRDRHILIWTMAAIGLGSLLAGAAMQTEPLRSLCGCGTTAQAGSGEDCVQNRMAEVMARAQLLASDPASQADHPQDGEAIPRPVEKADGPPPKRPTERPVPPPPSPPRGPEPAQP